MVMKIKGGGGVGRAGGVGKAKKTGKSKGAAFAGKVGQEDFDLEDAARKVRSRLMEELQLIAAEVAEGEATNEEASRKFVGLVIKERFGEQKGKGGKLMQESVADLVEEDEQFVSRLSTQLKKIAKS